MTERDLSKQIERAVRYFWATRSTQLNRQKGHGGRDQGARGAVTGGRQMDEFVEICKRVVSRAGIPDDCVYERTAVELPGFYRPTKKWDLVVVRDSRLLLALETKSQVGSFGNNFNNRTEEAVGSATDIWTAFRAGAFGTHRPWLGYLFMLEDTDRSTEPVAVAEPHFRVFPEFVGASYAKRYELLCRKLVLERQYDSACFLMSSAVGGRKGKYRVPANDIGPAQFFSSMSHHARGEV